MEPSYGNHKPQKVIFVISASYFSLVYGKRATF